MVNNFQYVLDNYQNEPVKVDSNTKIYKILRYELRKQIKEILNRDNFKVDGSNGKGMKTSYPWVSILNTDIKAETQHGYYIVYLFKKDLTGFYLSLNQGITYFKTNYPDNTYESAQRVSDYFRTQVKESSFSKEPITLGDGKTKDLGYGYGKTNIISKYYESKKFTYDQLKKDLLELVDVYDDMVKFIGYSYEEVIKNVLNAESDMIYASTTADEAIEEINKLVSEDGTQPYDLDIKLEEVEPVVRKSKRFSRVTSPIHKKIDYVKKAETDLKNGLRGEKLVLEWEKQKLIKAGREDLIDQIKWISNESDAFGYDIDSFEIIDGKEKAIKIEVKATTNKIDNDFFISKHEIDKSKELKDCYCVYRIYDLNSVKPKFYRVFGMIEDHFDLNPITYMAKYRG